MLRNTCTLGIAQPERIAIIKPSIIDAYGNWLNTFDWDYYCTFTTRYQLSLKSARRYMPKLQCLLSHGQEIPPIIFWVAEPFDAKYGCHLHALVLIENKSSKTKTSIKNAWQVVSKGKGAKEYNNTTIKKYDPTKGGHFYVSKYLHKNSSDYDFLF